MRIILGVCGSISAYKSIEVMRLLVKEGHQVRVVLTAGAEQFIRPELFNYLGAENVYRSRDDFKYPHEIHKNGNSNVLHIELANWAQKVIIAPLSANTLANFVHAKANDLLTSLFLALDKSKFISVFPAMNTKMLNHPFVQENLANLKKLKGLENIYVDATNSGDLACGETGEGRLAEVSKIALLGAWANRPSKQQSILLTTGGTIAPLDPVRFLANPSSGITGLEIAKQAIDRGFHLVIIKGYKAIQGLDDLASLEQVTTIEAATTEEMYQQVHSHLARSEVFIASAAVADIQFSHSSQKIKKETLQEGSLAITQAHDILASVLEKKPPQLLTIGFAAETELTQQMLNQKWERKPVDLLVGNIVQHGTGKTESKGFGTLYGNYLIKEKNNFIEKSASKQELAQYLLNWIENWKS